MENVKYIPGDLVKINGVVNVIDGIYSKSFSKDRVIEANALEGADTARHRYDLDFGRVVTIEPIPLTPQILEANGWKPDGEWLRFRTGKAYIYICESSSQRGTYLVCVGDNKYFIACISYIHQLQHLLFGLGLNSELKV